MVVNKKYKITKRVKTHTSPLVLSDVVQQGKFIKETAKYFVFDAFRVRKNLVVETEIVEEADKIYRIVMGERGSGKIAFLEDKVERLQEKLKKANRLICELCEKCGEDVCKNEECDWKVEEE